MDKDNAEDLSYPSFCKVFDKAPHNVFTDKPLKGCLDDTVGWWPRKWPVNYTQNNEHEMT